MDPTPRQLKTLRVLRSFYDRLGGDVHVPVENLADVTRLSVDILERDLHLLHDAGLVLWAFYGDIHGHQGPRSEGVITHEGHSLAYGSTWRARLRRWLPKVVLSLSVTALGGVVGWVVSPASVEALLVGLAGGAVGGGFLARLLRPA